MRSEASPQNFLNFQLNSKLRFALLDQFDNLKRCWMLYKWPKKFNFTLKPIFKHDNLTDASCTFYGLNLDNRSHYVAQPSKPGMLVSE